MKRTSRCLMATVAALAVGQNVLAQSSPDSTFTDQSQSQQDGARMGSGQITLKHSFGEAHGPIRGPLYAAPPALSPEQISQLREATRWTSLPTPEPVDPTVDPATIRPMNPPTTASEGQERGGVPGDFELFRLTSFSTTGLPWPSDFSTVNEPSLGTAGRVAFWTGNWYAAISTDAGQSFSYINPFDNFNPDGSSGPDGILDVPANAEEFCCDQIAYYERTRGMMIWLLQYGEDGNSNIHRLAIANSQDDLANNEWFWWELTPSSFGFAANGFWLDFPDLTVSDNFLYHTTNVFTTPAVNSTAQGPQTPTTLQDTTQNWDADEFADWRVRLRPGQGNEEQFTIQSNTATTLTIDGTWNNPPVSGVDAYVIRDAYAGSVFARYPLDDLFDGGGLSVAYMTNNDGAPRATHGATTTMYWAQHLSTTQIRIYRLAESSGTIFWDDVNHSAYNTGAMTAPNPDGSTWLGRADTRILGAWVANGIIGFMWNAAQGGGFSFPHVEVLRFQESDRSLIDQGQIYNNNYAWVWPAVHPNDQANLGGTIIAGGGTLFPRTQAWIADDFNSDVITPLENTGFITGNDGPASNRWGDYVTARRHVQNGNTWVGSGFALIDGSGPANLVPRYVWFGRGQDTPPLSNTIYVDRENTSGLQNGTAVDPYNNINAGTFAATDGDTVRIQAGNYPEIFPEKILVISAEVTLEAQGGTVIIGE